MKQSTIVVRANGWEVNATRRPIYNLVEGPSEWRFDIAMRKLDGTPFERDFGRASATCFPHGLIGQGFDGDALGVSGKTDDYNSVDPWHPVMWRTAQAEGAIEGVGSDYKLQSAVSTVFKFSRYLRKKGDSCAPRNVTKLLGAKAAHAAGNHEVWWPLSMNIILLLVKLGGPACEMMDLTGNRTCVVLTRSQTHEHMCVHSTFLLRAGGLRI